MAEYERVEQVEIKNAEIEIDDRGRVVIANRELAAALDAQLRGEEIQVRTNFNCGCSPGDAGVGA